MNTPRYPEISVQLAEQDGNAMAIIARVIGAMRRAHVSENELSEFADEAMSGNYDNVLQTCMRWVHVP